MFTCSLMDRKTLPEHEDFKESENGSSSIGIQTIERNNFDLEESPPDDQRLEHLRSGFRLTLSTMQMLPNTAKAGHGSVSTSGAEACELRSQQVNT